MSSSRKTVAVIGAEGFIGSSFCRYINESRVDGLAVTGLGRDRFDLTDPRTWSVLERGLDCLVHAATLVDGSLYDIFKVNTLFARELAEFCNERQIRKLVYLSTGAVYGSAAVPASSDQPENPDSPYAVAKFLAEKIFLEVHSGPVNVLRLYFPFGRGQKPPRLFPRLVQSIRNGDPVACNPGGGPRLSVIHVDDLCEILIRDFILDEKASGKWNVASNETVTISIAAKEIAHELRTGVRLSEDGDRPDVLSVPYARSEGKAWRPFSASELLA